MLFENEYQYSHFLAGVWMASLKRRVLVSKYLPPYTGKRFADVVVEESSTELTVVMEFGMPQGRQKPETRLAEKWKKLKDVYVPKLFKKYGFISKMIGYAIVFKNTTVLIKQREFKR